MRPFHRKSSSASSNTSMASLTIKGFHPVRERANTAISGINDTLSLMSFNSRKENNSESSSWIDNFNSMQSIHSDMLPGRPLGDDGSVRSFLSDVSNDLNALDLAEPLLPPLSLNDSHQYMNRYDQYMNRPDPWREIWLLNVPLSHAWPDLCCVHNSIFHRQRFYVCMSSAKLSFLCLQSLSVWTVLWSTLPVCSR